MADRFFISEPLQEGRGRLTDDQARHALQVMRHKVGDEIKLFDERGWEFSAKITAVDRRELSFVVDRAEEPATHLNPKLTVACALPKGDRQRFLIEKLVELGCDQFIPLACHRSVSLVSKNVIPRLQKYVVEACKQSGRRYLMTISEEQPVDGLLRQFSDQTSALLLLAAPKAEHSLLKYCIHNYSDVVVAIGPEGGFAEPELNTFEACNWQPVYLSDAILRIETAAITAIGLLHSMRSSPVDGAN